MQIVIHNPYDSLSSQHTQYRQAFRTLKNIYRSQGQAATNRNSDMWMHFLTQWLVDFPNAGIFTQVAQRELTKTRESYRGKSTPKQPARPKPKSKKGKAPKAYLAIRKSDKKCRYCMKGNAETIDHVIPRCKGGSDHVSNLVGCCVKCNQKKQDKLPKEAEMTLHLPLRFFTYTSNNT